MFLLFIVFCILVTQGTATVNCSDIKTAYNEVCNCNSLNDSLFTPESFLIFDKSEYTNQTAYTAGYVAGQKEPNECSTAAYCSWRQNKDGIGPQWMPKCSKGAEFDSIICDDDDPSCWKNGVFMCGGWER
jgi:hypothetical protein